MMIWDSNLSSLTSSLTVWCIANQVGENREKVNQSSLKWLVFVVRTTFLWKDWKKILVFPDDYFCSGMPNWLRGWQTEMNIWSVSKNRSISFPNDAERDYQDCSSFHIDKDRPRFLPWATKRQTLFDTLLTIVIFVNVHNFLIWSVVRNFKWVVVWSNLRPEDSLKGQLKCRKNHS